MMQIKEKKKKSPDKELNEIKASSLPDAELETIHIKMLKEQRERDEINSVRN